MPAYQNAPASPGNISKFKISSNVSDKALDLSGGVVEFRYYESVLSNNITATAVVVDSGYEGDGGSIKAAKGVLDSLPIRGGEREQTSQLKIIWEINLSLKMDCMSIE